MVHVNCVAQKKIADIDWISVCWQFGRVCIPHALVVMFEIQLRQYCATIDPKQYKQSSRPSLLVFSLNYLNAAEGD